MTKACDINDLPPLQHASLHVIPTTLLRYALLLACSFSPPSTAELLPNDDVPSTYTFDSDAETAPGNEAECCYEHAILYPLT